MILKEQVRHIAKLARISISQKEEERYQKELSSILEFFEKLKEVNVKGAEPTFYPLVLENVVREDQTKEIKKEKNQKLMELAPLREGDFVKVKSVF